MVRGFRVAAERLGGQRHGLATQAPRPLRLGHLADDVLVDGGGEPLHGARQGRAQHPNHVEEALVPGEV